MGQPVSERRLAWREILVWTISSRIWRCVKSCRTFANSSRRTFESDENLAVGASGMYEAPLPPVLCPVCGRTHSLRRAIGTKRGTRLSQDTRPVFV
jgi:hypothetical protein